MVTMANEDDDKSNGGDGDSDGDDILWLLINKIVKIDY